MDEIFDLTGDDEMDAADWDEICGWDDLPPTAKSEDDLVDHLATVNELRSWLGRQ